MITVPLTLRGYFRGESAEKLNIAHYLFLLYWLMKPFYFGPSGNMQPADFVFVISFVAWVATRKFSIVVDRKDFSLALFLLCVMVINGIYYAIYQDTGFLMTIAYYVYCFLVVLVVRDLMHNKRFLRGLMWASAFNLIVQLGVLMLGLGNYMWRGFRFMGTFNDPNQYAFSMLTSFLLVFILSSYLKEIEKNRKKFLVLLAYGLAAFFIVQGGSTGMLLGIGVFSMMFLLTVLYSERTPAFQFLKVLAILAVILVFVIIMTQGMNVDAMDASASSGSFLFFRLFQKAELVETGGAMGLFKDRAIDKLFNYPIYLFFGSGEGAHDRFPGPGYEVHSTFPGILFYYGIIPFLILLRWLKGNLRNVSRILIPVYVALFIESLTLAHQRQPAFWMILMLGSLEYEDPKALRKYRITTTL